MRKCVFLGYGKEPKGYRLYDPNEGKVIFSRDVKFSEGEKEEGTATNNAPAHLIELDFTDNCEMTSDSENCPTEQPIAESIPRRSERERRPPNFYEIKVNVTSQSPKEPKAMETEMQSLKANKVWDLVELPKGRKAIGSKWVYKVKTGADDQIERYKAR